MTDPFVHLHVASGYSLRYGASLPDVLVQRAADHGMDTLALTDRDGVYGAVKFAKACAAAGIRPVLGTDLAIAPSGLLPLRDPGHAARRLRTPARGDASVDLRLPRVTVLARDGRGWASLCRLISATHLRGWSGEAGASGEAGRGGAPQSAAQLSIQRGAQPHSQRGAPVTFLELLAEHAAGGHLFVLLGPDSEVGRAFAQRRPDIARAVLRRWREAVGEDSLRMEIVSFRGPDDSIRAGRMLGLADDERVGAVLTNAVRYADRGDAPVADVLDAARRLVALDLRHVDRVTAEGYLKSGKEMRRIADDVVRAAGDDGSTRGGGAAARLLAATRALAEQCVIDPRRDLGVGEVHFPELDVLKSAGLNSARSQSTRSQSAGSPSGGLDLSTRSAAAILRDRCEAGIGRRGAPTSRTQATALRKRLDDELNVISALGYPSYFLTVADVTDLIRQMGVRVAARGSGAGSLVNYLLGISGVDPMRHGLLMERFLSPLRKALPDIDIDVESERRMEVYERILERFGAERTTCVSMMDTYRVRHAIRDVGAALGLPPGEIDTLAKAFPHLRARDARRALRELPELRASGIASSQLDLLFALVERLDGLPRHIALHPCGVLLSDSTLLDRTPVEASWLGFPMSQFDKDDVEDLGLLKLDVLGIRMQSAMAHSVAEIQRVDGASVDLDAVPLDDPATFELIASTRTLGCFQIESPGQRELIGKFGPESFHDLIIDISLFRPGPVKSDMVTPFLNSRHGWKPTDYLHDDLRPALEQTAGVVVFHEQVLEIFATLTGCSLPEADEARRGLGNDETQRDVEIWFRPRALAKGYSVEIVDQAWRVLKAFGSFGFCKAHAAAFALPTYQSAWLKTHHPAAFFAGILTADPGMYPKRLILSDARQFGIDVLPIDVNASAAAYVIERLNSTTSGVDAAPQEAVDVRASPDRASLDRASLDHASPDGGALPDSASLDGALRDGAAFDGAAADGAAADGAYNDALGSGFRDGGGQQTPGARRATAALATHPDPARYGIRLGLADVKGINQAEIARVLAGRPYTSLADFWQRAAVSKPVVERLVLTGAFDSLAGPRVTRRDLLLQVSELEVLGRATRARSVRGSRGRSRRQGARGGATGIAPGGAAYSAGGSAVGAAGTGGSADDVRILAARQSQAALPIAPVDVQLPLFGEPLAVASSGLPEMTGAERVRAELEVLGLDASGHVLDFYETFLDALEVRRSSQLRSCRSRQEVLVAGVKVATQTPPIRSGKRVVFVTLDDPTGPVDATFFEDAQIGYATTLFGSWLLLVRGEIRRTGRRGMSLRATGCWELSGVHESWRAGGLAAVHELLDTSPFAEMASVAPGAAVAGAAASRSTRPVLAQPPVGGSASGFESYGSGGSGSGSGAGGMAPRKLWHSSSGSSGG